MIVDVGKETRYHNYSMEWSYSSTSLNTLKAESVVQEEESLNEKRINVNGWEYTRLIREVSRSI